MANDFDDRSRGDAATFGEKMAVLKERLNASEKRQEEQHAENKTLLQQILDQVRSTNGRVCVLEMWRAGREKSGEAREKDWLGVLADVELLRDERNKEIGSRRVFTGLWGLGIIVGSALLEVFLRHLWK